MHGWVNRVCQQGQFLRHPLAGSATADGQDRTRTVSDQCLPEPIRAAVEEVAGFVKAPLPMVASSALAALSLAIQAHVDVSRAARLQGPAGLFLLTIADSGERKSTCDGFFTKPIRETSRPRRPNWPNRS